jgi:mitochondrial fission protein ELM1
MAGTENQCLGVAEALGARPVVKRIGLRQPWRLLSPWLGFECAFTFTGDALAPPWPDLLIASGRKSIAAARYVRKRNGNKTFIVQIQDPRASYDTFDLIAVPQHDPARGKNIIVTQAAPNRITPQALAAGREDFAALLSPFSAPCIAVMIGGNSKSHSLTDARLAEFAGQLRSLAESGYSLMVTVSRRTGAGQRRLLEETLQAPNVYFWDGTGPNPYMGFLAWADVIIVTADSVSMISEAATTGKPVYIAALEGGGTRLDKFHESLLNKGIARRFEGSVGAYSYNPLNDAAFVAGKIRKNWEKP